MRQSGTISSWLLSPMWPGFESQRILSVYSVIFSVYSVIYSELSVLRVLFIARSRGISYWYSCFPLSTKSIAPWGNPGQSWILHFTLWIPDCTGFQYLSVELGFFIPIRSLFVGFCIPWAYSGFQTLDELNSRSRTMHRVQPLFFKCLSINAIITLRLSGS